MHFTDLTLILDLLYFPSPKFLTPHLFIIFIYYLVCWNYHSLGFPDTFLKIDFIF